MTSNTGKFDAYFKDGWLDECVLSSSTKQRLFPLINILKESLSVGLKNPELKDFMEIVFGMLTYKPEERRTNNKIFAHKFLKEQLPLELKLKHGISNPKLSMEPLRTTRSPIVDNLAGVDSVAEVGGSGRTSSRGVKIPSGITCGCFSCTEFLNKYKPAPAAD